MINQEHIIPADLSAEREFDLQRSVSAEEIDAFFRMFLNRPVGNGEYVEELVATNITRGALAKMLIDSFEFRSRYLAREEIKRATEGDKFDNYTFRIPEELSINPAAEKKVLLVGSCLMASWKDTLAEAFQQTQFDSITFNNASKLPALSKAASDEYAFQILQIATRSVIPEALYFNVNANDLLGYENAFEIACQRLRINLENIIEYNTQFGLTSYVLGFLTPQQNSLGRFQPRFSKSNMVYFVESLNKELYKLIENTPGVFFVDFDQIVGSFGKKYFQDDSITHFNHGSVLGEILLPGDEKRLEHPGHVHRIYNPNISRVIISAFAECLGHSRSLRQEGSIKLAIFDLDDTLWRGVAAEEADLGSNMIEGWPLGILEAASYLWKRGVLIAIVSKNDEANVTRIWETLYGKVFPLENFVSLKINWESKSKNIATILAETNLLPSSVVFIDDNPVERAAVKSAFPEIRLIEGPVAVWRRVLLWAPELQPFVITKEATARTQMIQAQVIREEARLELDRSAFLLSLELIVETSVITDMHDNRFNRSFELLNKTNQFNTTGIRWTTGEISDLFTSGGYFVVAEVSDRYTNYGLVVLCVVNDNMIEQVVMSCRVFGLGVEAAFLNSVIKQIETQSGALIEAKLVETQKNKLCLSFFQENGFEPVDALRWRLQTSGPTIPAHVRQVSIQK